MRDILPHILEWQARGERVALATVIRTGGHAPREVGSSLAMLSDGSFAGSVSGGCIESSVIQTALEVLLTGTTQLLSFGEDLASIWEVGLSCGGGVDVLIYEAPRDMGERDKTVALSIDYEGSTYHIPVLDGSRRPQLICVGGVHIAYELIKLAKNLDYTTVVIDPRKMFLTKERFPHADTLIGLWPQEAFENIIIDENTAICVLTHDPKIDVPALVGALESEAFYIGSLGSSSTQTKRYQALCQEGVDPLAVKRVHGPIGLNLGGRAPEEIALSIMAQITATHYGRDAASHLMFDFID